MAGLSAFDRLNDRQLEAARFGSGPLLQFATRDQFLMDVEDNGRVRL